MALVGAMNAIIIVSDHHWFATAIFFLLSIELELVLSPFLNQSERYENDQMCYYDAIQI